MNEQDVIELLKRENEEFRKLYQEHRELDNTLMELNKKNYLTTEEELEVNKMKKAKLYKKDKIAEMVREYKKSNN